MSDPNNIFISHIGEDDQDLQNLKALLTNNGHDIRDSSIDSSKPNQATDEAYIKSGILAPAINWAGTLVVLVSPDTHKSSWVDWEIEYAEQKGKRIVGVWSQGSQDSDLPTGLALFADAIVGWQGDRIMDAITGKINNWFTASGEERKAQPTERWDCGKRATE